MDLQLANEIAEAMHERDEYCDVHSDYSGRGMYGETTAAIVVDGDLTTAMHCFAEYRELNGSDYGLGVFRRFRSDNMGKSMIYY